MATSLSSSGSWLQRVFSGKQQEVQHKAAPSWYGGLQAYMHPAGKAVWSGRDYAKFAQEAYQRNVVAYRAIALIAQGIGSHTLLAYDEAGQKMPQHPLLRLLNHPNPQQGKATFLEALVSYYLLSGNAYMQAVSATGEVPRELHLLRPDRVKVIAGKQGMPAGYIYTVDQQEMTFPVDPLRGTSRILHIRHFHPLHDWYGQAPSEAAAYSIDQHNQAAAWNQGLLQNGARPSGALVMQMTEQGGRLSEEQYSRLKQQVDTEFTGASNAGKPLLLEGGLEWKEMSLTPRDMDFLNIKHSAARDIALAYGVPPQLLGIPGDNTYANLAEARLALWEQTILPMSHLILGELCRWLNPLLGTDCRLDVDMDKLSALAPKRQALWNQVKDADFLSDAEKREMLGFS